MEVAAEGEQLCADSAGGARGVIVSQTQNSRCPSPPHSHSFHSYSNFPLHATMQAIRLQKKYPEVTQDEMFELINRFKCVITSFLFRGLCRSTASFS